MNKHGCISCQTVAGHVLPRTSRLPAGNIPLGLGAMQYSRAESEMQMLPPG